MGAICYWAKKGEKGQKHMKNTTILSDLLVFCERFALYLRAIRSNHEQIIHRALF